MSMSSKIKKKDEKRKARNARKALYKSQSESKKEKKFQNALSGFNAYKHRHTIHNCGNPGCSRCFPLFSIENRKVVKKSTANKSVK